MIYSLDGITNDIESRKERNLYAKFFAGYWFNPLVEGLPNRIERFKSLLREPQLLRQDIPQAVWGIRADTALATFDKHLPKDPAECADILIYDPSAPVIVGVEVKLHTDWTFESDVVLNAKRLIELNHLLCTEHQLPLLVLLLTESKWSHGKRQHRETIRPHYQRLRDDPVPCPVAVLLWEQFLSDVPETVRRFVSAVIDR